MGEDSIRPFLVRPDRGAVLLCRTSNPGAKDFQDLLMEGLPLYRHVEKNDRLLEYKCVEFAEEIIYGPLRKKPAK